MNLTKLNVVWTCAFVLVFSADWLSAQVDDFSSGNDSAWTHYDPFGQFGLPATYSVSNGQYSITAPALPGASAAGPSRAGSLRTDVSYTDFSVGIDLDAWTMDHDAALGLLARITNPGLGTTDGYAFTYSTGGHSIDLSKVTGEAPHGLASTSVTLDPTQSYRLVLTGIGSSLTGQLFNTADLTTPIASISANDATYGSGVNGLVVFDNTNPGVQGAFATFDNYAAAVATPEPATLAALPFVALLLRRKR